MLAKHFEGQSLRQIYTNLYLNDYSELWVQVAKEINSKASYCRFYYVDCYLRGAFKDSMKQRTKIVDQFILEKIQENLPEWQVMTPKQRFSFVRQQLRDKFMKPDESGELVYHMEQLYDHSLNFIRPRGAFVESEEDIHALFRKCASQFPYIYSAPKRSEDTSSKGKSAKDKRVAQNTSEETDDYSSDFGSTTESASESEATASG